MNLQGLTIYKLVAIYLIISKVLIVFFIIKIK